MICYALKADYGKMIPWQRVASSIPTVDVRFVLLNETKAGENDELIAISAKNRYKVGMRRNIS